MTKAKQEFPKLIDVIFKPRIKSSGGLVRVTIKQDDMEIQLTKEQAHSLIRQINMRIES